MKIQSFLHRLIAPLAFALIASSLTASAPAHATTTPTRVAVICDDAGSTTRATQSAAIARITASAHELLGRAAAYLYWRPVTDASFDVPAIATISIAYSPAPRARACQNPFDVRCRQANTDRQRAYAHRLRAAQLALAGQLRHLAQARMPRARHAPDVLGCVAAAAQLFRRTTRNYLIIIGSLQTAPPHRVSLNLHHADLDVVWRPSGPFQRARALQRRWQALFHALGVPDQAWLRPEELPAWHPVGKS
jgi:hypothetical protein